MESPTGTLIALLLADSSDFGLLGEQSSLKNGTFPVLDAEEPHTKFDTTSFILGGEICNRTNKQIYKQTKKKTKNKHTNSK